MRNLIVLGNGFDIDLGLKTTFKAFRESFEFCSIADIPLIKKIRDNQWNDIEGTLREELIEYSKNPNDEWADSINHAWLMITKRWGVYLPQLTDLDKIEINKNSCAYNLLIADQEHGSTWYTFNYTNPWYLCQLSKESQPVFIHNETVPLDWAKQHGLCHYIPMNLIFGVDSMMPSCIAENKKLSHIIKANNPYFDTRNKENLFIDLQSTQKAVFFGQSFGITDSDYFRPYLNSVINGETNNRNIFIVTSDQCSLKGIIDNMSKYDINFENLKKSKVNINIVFTKGGVASDGFQPMITELYKQHPLNK